VYFNITLHDVICWQILDMLSEVTIAVRTKALKCLTSVITVDPSVLAWVSCTDFCQWDYPKSNFSAFQSLCDQFFNFYFTGSLVSLVSVKFGRGYQNRLQICSPLPNLILIGVLGVKIC